MASIVDWMFNNMQVAITGHTSGLGKCIFDRFHPDSLGFSRSTGYDISNKSSRKLIVEQSKDADVFINNAYNGFNQIDMLYDMFESWQDTNKLIVNISSTSSNDTKNRVHPYSIHKTALDKASAQLFNTFKSCRICNVKPDWIDTPRVAFATDELKLTPDAVTDVIEYIINLPHNLAIPTITIFPRRN